jgi:glycerol kinase
MALFLGLDLGTTLATALLLDEDGREVRRHSVAVPTRTPQPGCVEQDPHALVAAMEEAAAPLLDGHDVTAVGLANQGESFVLWDAVTGEALTPNIVWQDQRGAPLCRRLESTVDAAWLARRTGLRLDTYFSAPKLATLLASDAALRQHARAGRVRFGTTDSWFIHRCTGGKVHVTDVSTASRTLLFDVTRLRWDPDLLALFDVPAAMLPAVLPSGGDPVQLRLCGRTLPLRAMLVDQAAALLGQGCVSPGDAKCTFGTGSFLLMNTGETPRWSAHGLLTTIAWQLGDAVTWALDGGVLCSGAAVQWLHEKLGVIPSVASSGARAAVSTDPGVVVVPALTGLGAPRWRTDARGAVFGLSLSSNADDITRATLDGIACLVSDVVDAMRRDGGPIPVLRVDGGPTHNVYLMQVLADVLDVPVHVAARRESTAVGAALLAQHVATRVPLADLVARLEPAGVVHPRADGTGARALRTRWEAALTGLAAFHDALPK